MLILSALSLKIVFAEGVFGKKIKGIILTCQYYPPPSSIFYNDSNRLGGIKSDIVLTEATKSSIKEDKKAFHKTGFLSSTVLFTALVCSLQLCPATVLHAESIFIGSGIGGQYGRGSDYNSDTNPVPFGTYDKIYGGRIDSLADMISKSVTGNVLKLDKNYTINDNGKIYGGCYYTERVIGSYYIDPWTGYETWVDTDWEVQVGAKDDEDDDTKSKNKNIVTIVGTNFKGSAAIYGGCVEIVSVDNYVTDARSLSHNNRITVSYNTVEVSGITGATTVEVYGGYIANVANVNSADACATSFQSSRETSHGFTASDNTVTLSDIEASTVEVHGGYAANVANGGYASVTSQCDSANPTRHSLTASDNTVTLSGIEASTVEVYGGYAANVANSGTASAGSYADSTNITSSSHHGFTASGNTVTLSGIEASTVEVYGGYAANVANSGTADAKVYTYNSSYDGATFSDAIADHGFTASGNTVTLSGIEASTVEVYGGYAANVENKDSANADAKLKVSINNWAVAVADKEIKAVNSHTFAASDNTVTVSDVKDADSVKIYGGWGNNDSLLDYFKLSSKGNTVQITESVTASGNRVYLYNVDANEVYGGKSSVTFGKNDSVDLATIAFEGVTINGTAAASNNRVELHGGSYKGENLYAGYSSADILSGVDISEYVDVQRSAEAINNKVALYAYEGASPKLDGAVLWGGYAKINGVEVAGDKVKENNRLEFHEVKGMTAKNIKNFSTLTFTLPAMAAGEAVLTLTDAEGTDISGAAVTVENKIIEVKGADGGEFKKGDEVVLLKNASGLAKDGVTYNSRSFDGQPDADSRKVLGQTGISLQYTLELQETGNSIVLKRPGVPDDGNDTTHVLPQTKAIAEGAIAGLALVNESANAAIELARNFSPATGIVAPFIHVQGSSVTHETGSSVHLSSVSLAAGIGTGLETGVGKVSAGAFFEYGKGSYTTNNSFDNAADVNGDGDAWYMGGGILAKMDFVPTGPGHFYVQGSAHMGQLHNEYDSSDLRDVGGRIAKFDMDSPYYSLHGGLGYVWNFAVDHDVDVYGNYIWTRVDGTDETLTTGDRFEFDDMDSSRVRFGARYTYRGNERFRPYAGVAYEHEFAAPSFEGDTGIGELGIRMTPSESLPLSINLGVQGYVGQKRGVSGNCMVRYEF